MLRDVISQFDMNLLRDNMSTTEIFFLGLEIGFVIGLISGMIISLKERPLI